MLKDFQDRSGAQTPEETNQTVERLADQLSEMDRTEGVFGEFLEDDLADLELEQVAGGQVPIEATIVDGRTRTKQTSQTIVSAATPGSTETSQEKYQKWLQQVGATGYTGQS